MYYVPLLSIHDAPIDATPQQISLELISGSKVDYAMELIKRSFVIAENPNAEAGCGCGISFSLK